MSNGLLARLLPLTAANITITSQATAGINAAFPVSAAVDPQPKVVVQTNVQAGTNILLIELDLGVATTFDTLAVLYANMSSSAQWSVYGGAGFGAVGSEAVGSLILGSAVYGAFGVAPSATRARRHALLFGAAVTVRYVRIYLKDFSATNPEQLIRVGNIVIGNNVLPTSTFDKNFELGSARRIGDLSEIEQLPGGEFNRNRRAKVPGFRARWSNLTDAEARTLFAALDEIGESEPLLLVEDPDLTAGQNERIHYGLLRGLDTIERSQADKQVVDLQIQDWL